MARIAFILLCHKDPEAVIQQATQLTSAGDDIAIHFDRAASPADYRKIRQALADNPHVAFVARRVRCGWGEWSLVAATLRTVETALAAFGRATHFYMISGDCMPIKSARYVHDYLDAADKDYIESFDFFDSWWIKTGFREERLIYRHYFNERRNKRLFYAAFQLQKRLGLTRAMPAELQMMVGSQWWCLRRHSVEQIVDFARQRRDIIRFFRRTWIPDETFFQTLIRHLVPGREIEARTLTFLMFTDYGLPVTFYNDHLDMLLGQDALFARKISPQATTLRAALGAVYASDRSDFPITQKGTKLFSFVTGLGRHGRRFAPRFWEAETSIGRDRSLLIILCKKWHVAKRLTAAIRTATGLPVFDYLFDEDTAALPDLGGLETALDKRVRHRRAFMRLLYEAAGADRVVICLDPANLEVVRDFCDDRAEVHLLDIACQFSPAYLKGHALRIGLAGPQLSAPVLDRLLTTILHEIANERAAIRDTGFDNISYMRETATEAENAAVLARFLRLDRPVALALARTPHLFED